jgi:hypothetical protein
MSSIYFNNGSVISGLGLGTRQTTAQGYTIHISIKLRLSKDITYEQYKNINTSTYHI